MRLRAKLAVVLVVSTLAVAGCAWVLVAKPGQSDAPTSDATVAATNAFFDQYVDGDGRVVRRDQGGDTVSEGQSYALLLAAVGGDRKRFDEVWAWTTAHLRRADGLLSWRYADGAVTDPMSATDADVQAAWALSIATRRFGDDRYATDGRALAHAILDHESVAAGGMRYLAAGPWATGDPTIVNPSYAIPAALDDLGRLTGDPRWNNVLTSSRTLGNDLGHDAPLPPDWISIDDVTAHVQPIAAPDHSTDAPRYSLDASRLVAWFGADCDGAARATAATWASTLDDHPRAQKRQLSGAPIDADESAASEAGAAVATRAAGDRARADAMLDDARRLDHDHSTYYGAAWIALAEALVDSHSPLACPTT